MYAEIIIEYPVKSLDKMFTYIIPSNIMELVCVGMKVLVPFGKNTVNGFILKIKEENSSEYELKEIIDIVDKELILSEELLKLGSFMQEKTLCTRISAYQAMLPSSYKAKTNKTNYNIYTEYILLNKDIEYIKKYIEENKRSKKQNEILLNLIENKKVNRKSFPTSLVKILLEKKLIKLEKEQAYRDIVSYKSEQIFKLTTKQNEVYESVDLSKTNTYLLYGITGSGKTEIYLKLIEDVIKAGKTAVMLVSEISLTMQIVKRFYARFKDNVAVFHSALSEGEKHDEYLKIINEKVKIVVGTRSAIFAPLKNIGIIIIDEEHSETYKQDNNPRYNAKEMALFRCEYNNCPLVLGSATPTLDSMARAIKGVYKLLVLNERVGQSTLPNTIIVDMEKEIKMGNNYFSKELIDEINNTLEKDKQVILLLNRRGFSTFVTCSSCGYNYKCPHCDITLTYHKTTNNLVCHYCGYLTKKEEVCPKCHEKALNFLGLGTEKLEEYIKELFIKAKVIRMDQDTTTKKGSHDKIIESFKNKEYNILLGTQMISKGLDFKDVTLVGVINADTSLNVPDYKANENTFSLLNQVAGRAGRSNNKGKVILQTFNPNNDILKFSANNDYKSFYLSEMKFRNKLKYPPYYFLVGIKIISKEYNQALSEAKKIVDYLKQNLEKETIILGPTTAALLKYKNNYRFQVIIKYKRDNKLLNVLKNLDINYAVKKEVMIEIDINPNKI